MNRLPRGFVAGVPLGQGGEARTCLCWQSDPGRWVVLKVGKATGAARLRREARHLERLAGGPVPALLGQDLSGREPWLAMTWIDGIPLDALPDSLALSDRKAILLQASLAVARLHGARVVHADLSPANLIVRPHGEVGVVDFGLTPVPDSDEIPDIGGAWEILAPERLQGAGPDPRWDVFALGVIGARLLGGILPGAGSRDEWTNHVASGEAAKNARGKSWALSLALDPDPGVRPIDAAALVRLLEKEWGDPPFDRDRFAAENAARLETLFAAGVHAAASRKDWQAAWKLQRERIERAANPEPLLVALGEYQRKRLDPPEHRRLRRLALALGLVAACAGGYLGWRFGASEDKPSDLVPPSPSSIAAEFAELEGREQAPPNGVLVFDPPPSGTRLEIDGVASRLPPDGFLPLETGRHRVVLIDSTEDILLDTTMIVAPPRPQAEERPVRVDSSQRKAKR